MIGVAELLESAMIMCMEHQPGNLVNERISKLVALKSQASGLGLNLTLGLQSNIDNSEHTGELIRQIEAAINNFENTKDGFQREIDELTGMILNKGQ